MGYELSVNLELLFPEAGPVHADRVRAAADAGFRYAEIWSVAGKDLDALGRALAETGMALHTLAVEPPVHAAVPPSYADYHDRVRNSIRVAEDLGCARVVVNSGQSIPDVPHEDQLDRLTDLYSSIAEIAEGSGVTLLLENLNTLVDHRGALIGATSDAVQVIRSVDSPSLRLLYDLYHSIVQGEDPAAELPNAAGLVSHVQIADVPGRGEPGSGDLDWSARLAALRASGYDGVVGVEYQPTVGTLESLRHIREVAAEA